MSGDNIPPVNLAFERQVLGAAIKSADGLVKVTSDTTADDYFDIGHKAIFRALSEYVTNGTDVDPILLARRLERDKTLANDVDPYGHVGDLVRDAAPFAALPERIADVRACAQGRDLITMGRDLITQAADTGGDPEAVQTALLNADEALRVMADKVVSQPWESIEDLVEKAQHEQTKPADIPTGFIDLDRLLQGGLRRSQMVVIAARPAQGKALALDTPLPTPTGWTTMGEVQVGDWLLDAQGRPTLVTAATNTMTNHDCYEVEFSDGEVITADADHLWLTQTCAERRTQGNASGVRTTREVGATLRVNKDQRANHSVLVAQPLDLDYAYLPIEPYTFGAWLGGGASDGNRLCSATSEIPMMVEADGYVVRDLVGPNYSIFLEEPNREALAERPCPICGNTFVPAIRDALTCGCACGAAARSLLRETGEKIELSGCADYGEPCSGVGYCETCRTGNHTFQGLLRGLGVLGYKHIPGRYLRGNKGQRRDLLAGLLDTVGTVMSSGQIQLALTDKDLADDAYELIVSLGYRASRRTKQTPTCYITTFTAEDQVFRLETKTLVHKDRNRMNGSTRNRFIHDVRPVPSVPVRCIQVDNTERLYLAGRGMIPTHNTTLALDICRHATIGKDKPGLFVSLEMNGSELAMRLMAAEGKVPLTNIRENGVSAREEEQLIKVIDQVKGAPLYVLDQVEPAWPTIRSAIISAHRRLGIEFVLLDYLQLIESDGSSSNNVSREQVVSRISRGLKALGRSLDICVIVVAQLNRGPEQRTDKRPMASDLRESGQIEQDSDIIMLIYQPQTHDPTTTRVGEADIIVAKQRNGPTGDVTLAFQGHYARFADMARVDVYPEA